jgi:shikimate 5-dehydrogenase
MQLIRGTTKLLGVIGDPIEHSLSPVMQNAALAHMDLDYVYLPLPVKTADLGVAIAGFNAIGLVGFNVTIPHKQGIRFGAPSRVGAARILMWKALLLPCKLTTAIGVKLHH